MESQSVCTGGMPESTTEPAPGDTSAGTGGDARGREAVPVAAHETSDVDQPLANGGDSVAAELGDKASQASPSSVPLRIPGHRPLSPTNTDDRLSCADPQLGEQWEQQQRQREDAVREEEMEEAEEGHRCAIIESERKSSLPPSAVHLTPSAESSSAPIAAAVAAAAAAAAATASRTPAAAAWTLDFSAPAKKTKRKTTKKERDAMNDSHWRRAAAGCALKHSPHQQSSVTGVSASHQTAISPGCEPEGSEAQQSAAPSPSPLAAPPVVDSEGNVTQTHPQRNDSGNSGHALLPVVQLDGFVDRSMLIPTNLAASTRDRLHARLCFSIPRLLCVNKQYPRSCGVSSLTSIYNYLYSWLGETRAYSDKPPISQEELMTILGFEPPFGEIPWGSFTGNTTLIRWFYALNRHFSRPRGRAYILYKAHGHGKTTHLFDNDNDAVLKEVKRCLANPQCALIYHCHNHYMCPIGYQEIPIAQTDFLKPEVPPESCETTIFIGEVSRGRHEAIYARKWSEIVKDIECKSPNFFNIRHPELGIQSRAKGAGTAAKKKARTRASPTPTSAAVTTATTTLPPCPAPASPLELDAARDGDTAALVAEDLRQAERGDDTAQLREGGPLVDSGVSTAAAEESAGSTVPSAEGEATAERRTDWSATPAEAQRQAAPEAVKAQPPVYASRKTSTTSQSDAAAAVAADLQPLSQQQQQSKSRKERGNLHCLICFRTDEEEVNPTLYENSSEDSEMEMEDLDGVGDVRGRRSSSDEDEGGSEKE